MLLLHEVSYHPNSYIKKLSSSFEATSVVRVRGKDDLRKYSRAPLFDPKYLVIFEDLKLFTENKSFLNFSIMLPVLHLESKVQLGDAEFVCKEFDIPYKVYSNEFSRDDAYALIQSEASQPVSDSVCKAIVRQVGLSPLRILTAVGVCEQLGFKVSVVEHYIDKWVYPDFRRLIECLLGVPRNKSSVRRSLMYLHVNRYWFRQVRKRILEELEYILEVYKDKLLGKLGQDQLFSYIEEKQTTRSRAIFALGLFEKVSLSTVFALREFIKSADILEVAMGLNTLLGGM